MSDNTIRPKKQLLPFRVRDRSGQRRHGITAKSYSDLISKVRNKFEIDKKQKLCVVLETDGTEVDDDEYLTTLPHNPVLVLLAPGETWQGAEVSLDEALAKFLQATHLPQAAESIRACMEGESSVLHLDLLGKMAASLAMDIDSETRSEHKEWFADVAPKYKTKTSFMREKARVRVRGYLYHTKDYIQKQPSKARVRRKLEDALDDFIEMLKREDYYSDYFARGSVSSTVMCDEDGWFGCEGAFNKTDCTQPDHRINPYGSRDARILFSTWDLDHGIEKSRSILPSLREAANDRQNRRINVNYFFSLLFTRQNLRLVHPVCHDKTGHDSAKCDPEKIFL